jgi:hypothetical protein
MNPSNIVRVGAVCAALVVGACGFSPSGQGNPGSGASSGTGTGNTTGLGNFGGSSSGQGGLTGQGGGMQCGAYDRPSSKLPPDILIVLDASGSMNEDAMNMSCTGGCGALSKWALLTPALNQVVMETETEVNWGLKLFADVNNNTCGVSPNMAAVPIGASSAAAIAAAIAARTDAAGNITMGSRTPTRAAEDAAVTYLTGLTDPNPKFILMATDGQPNCPASGNSSNDDTPGAIAAVTAAATAGFPTFVVGISAPAGAANDALNGMADAGGYPRAADPRYYPVTSAAEFVAVLRTLVGVATTCTFSIPPPPTNDGTTSREDISVGSNTGPIPQDANNGWTYSDTTHTSITLHGSSCAAVENGTITNVTIIFNCHLT